MLTPVLDRHSGKPLYVQLYEYIREEIRSGRLEGGSRLPSSRTFSAYLSVSRSTIEMAYAQLDDEGYIRSRERSGYEVLPTEIRTEPAVQIRSAAPETADSTVYKYDLRTSGVDASKFPFTIWARLMRRMLLDHGGELLQSGPSQGILPLREAICEYLYQYRRVQAVPDQIVVGAGTETLLALLVQLLGMQTEYAVECPGFPRVEQILRNFGIDALQIPVDGRGLVVSELKKSAAQVVHVTPAHQFPTGAILSAGRRQELLKWACAAPERYVIEDDYDSEFRFSGSPVPSLQGMGGEDKVIYFYTFAQSLAPSLRIAYMVLPLPLVDRFRDMFHGYACTVPSFEQFTLAEFLKQGYYERHLNRMRKVYRGRQQALAAALRVPGIRLGNLNGGLYLILHVDPQVLCGADLTEEELWQRCIRQGIRITGMARYGGRTGADGQEPCFLVGFGAYDAETLSCIGRELIRAFKEEK